MGTTPANAADLAQLSPDEVDRYFAEGDAEQIVALVHAAPDTVLRELVAAPHVRSAAVRHVLGRLGELAIAERLAQVDGLVEFLVDVPDEPPLRHLLRFGDGGVRVVHDAGRPDVTIETGALDFVRLVTGGSNAALMLLADRLAVRGDAALALTVGGVFQVPGRPGAAVDPAAVDPEQVAAILGHVRDEHLREVMTGGFRQVILDQVFTRLPEFLDSDKGTGHRLRVGFTITGRPDGGADRYVVEVADGGCRVEPGGQPGAGGPGNDGRDATITASGADFLKLVTGHLNPVMGVMRGALKVRGDVKAALTLHKIMRIPGGR